MSDHYYQVAGSRSRDKFLKEISVKLGINPIRVIYRMISFFYLHPEHIEELRSIRELMPNDPRINWKYSRRKKNDNK
ncbi:MAG: hypothetical protein HXS54_06135 [Theionarchaea archaeon]|nr:hypothetical protein [Theionarchaea archaeon]DBA34838.1 TPA_asm: hypothetical protein vir521_00044 [Caudoviricetes sp. vir521]